MDAKSTAITSASTTVLPPQAGTGAPFYRCEAGGTDATYGIWINVQGGAAAVNGPGSVYVGPRSNFKLPHLDAGWKMCVDAGGGTVVVNVVAYTEDES